MFIRARLESLGKSIDDRSQVSDRLKTEKLLSHLHEETRGVHLIFKKKYKCKNLQGRNSL